MRDACSHRYRKMAAVHACGDHDGQANARRAGARALAAMASALRAVAHRPSGGLPLSVELEKDLSKKQQLLDVLVVRRGREELTRPLPDGLNDLVAHNLISFKSYREPLNDWTLKELTGHYVNYRQQVSPRGNLLPEDQFRLYAVCARHPRDLFAEVPPEILQAGVYTCRRGSDAIRIVVAAELPKEEKNALLHLFSAAPDQVEYGAAHYRLQLLDTSTIVKQLFEEYRVEGMNMPTIEDIRRDVAREYLRKLTPEEVLGLYTPAQIAGYLRRLRKKPAAARKKKPKPRN